jgi:hypothetical protein
VIRIQGRAVVYGELWFDEVPPSDAGVDILVHRYRAAPISLAHNLPLHSLRTDLAQTPEAIAAGFDETCRRHVRRAERQDGLRHEAIAEPVDALEEFAEFYDVFARQKGLWRVDRHWLVRAAQAGQLLLSCASREGERLVWHAHLRAGRTVQLAHSASLYRGMNDDYRSLVARANRWLHWRDMLTYKAMGLRYYDWGGMFADESTPERAGIHRFKRSFGGLPVLAYECSAPVTLRGRMWLLLRSALRRPPKDSRPAAASAA